MTPALADPRRVELTGSFPYRLPGAPLPATLGPQVCEWVERHCKLTGEQHGAPVRLARWQRAFLYTLYELEEYADPKRGRWMRRRYRTALLGMPKGNGKSPLASWVMAVETAGPSCFSGWDADGRPVGGLRPSPECYIGATNFKQSRLVFGDIAASFNASPELQAIAEVLADRIQLRGEPGSIERLSSNADGIDGARPSCFAADELHLWQNNAGVFLSLRRGAKKRPDSLVLAITTAGPGEALEREDYLLGKLYRQGKRTNDPADPYHDPKLLLWWYEAPDSVELAWDMPREQLETLIRQANPGADDFVSVEELADSFYAQEQPLYDFDRYHLNRWRKSAGQGWMPPGAWDSRALPTDDGGPVRDEDGQIVSGGLRPGERIVVGFDGSFKWDSTGIVAASLERPYLQVLALWERPKGAKEWQIDVLEVEQKLRNIHLLYDVREFACDQARWVRTIEVLAAEGLPMGVMSQRAESMGPATERLWLDVVNGAVFHDGDPRLADHVRNAVPKVTTSGTVIQKIVKNSPLRIDLAVCAVMAWARRNAPDDSKSTAAGMWDLDDIDLTDDDYAELGL